MMKLLTLAVGVLLIWPAYSWAEAASNPLSAPPMTQAGAEKLQAPAAVPAVTDSLPDDQPSPTSDQETAPAPQEEKAAPVPEPALPPTPEPVGMDQMWEEVENYIAKVKLEPALQSLKLLIERSRQLQDDENLTKALLTITDLYVQNSDYEAALATLYACPFPSEPTLKAIILMLRAYCVRQYFQKNAFIIPQISNKAETSDFHTWSGPRLLRSCRDDFSQAWEYRASLGDKKYDSYLKYFKSWNNVFGSGPTLRDYLTYAMADFFSDPSTWTPEEYKSLENLDRNAIMNFPRQYSQGLKMEPGQEVHPINRILFIFNDLANWHEENRKVNKAVQARLRCTEAVSRAFRKHKLASQGLESMQNVFSGNKALPEDLEAMKSNLKKRLSW